MNDTLELDFSLTPCAPDGPCGTHHTKADAIIAIRELQQFIGRSQLSCVGDLCRGEEKQFYFDKMCELAGIVRKMPKTYEQRVKDPVAYLHYFTGSADFYITEKDMDCPDSPGQHQAYGLADRYHDGGEIGYISIVELLANGAELDFHFTPKPLSAVC